MSSLVLSESEIAQPRATQAGDKLTAPRDGIHVALWIPFDERGALKRESLKTHLEWLKSKGVHGILALGSTGEFARMDYRKREEVLAEIIELSAPLPVIANISAIRLDEVISLGQAAARAGAVGAALMPPSFFPVFQEDMLEFFLRAADGVDLPFYLYNYPEVTGNRIGLEVIEAFADRARMVGIKQSGSELAYHKDLIALGRKKNFSVFTAADPLLAEYLALGADGCLGGLANFVPEYMLGVYDAYRRGEQADEMSSRLMIVNETFGPLVIPLNVRCGVEARGLDPGALKTVISDRTQSICRKVVADFQARFAEWGLEPVRS